jgi:hypothetical protein
MAAMNLTAGQYACSERDDRSVHKASKRHVGDGVVADDLKGLILYFMILTMSLDVHRNQFRLVGYRDEQDGNAAPTSLVMRGTRVFIRTAVASNQSTTVRRTSPRVTFDWLQRGVVPSILSSK